MKFVLLGTSDFTLQCASALIECGMELAALISMPAHLLPDNSADIAGFAVEHGVTYHEVEDINDLPSIELLKSYSPDYLFSTWPRIIKKPVLEIPAFFCIGTHPTKLPHNRGRHPLHWLLAMGIRESALSFFRMDEGIDSGNILLQIPYALSENDTIGDVVARVNMFANEGTCRLCKMLRESPDSAGIEQDQGRANYWRKRTLHDVTIDFRMSCSAIVRTVNSFAPPYPAAKLIFRRHVLEIIDASEVSIDYLQPGFESLEPGRVLESERDRDSLVVKTDDGFVRLVVKGEVPVELLAAGVIEPPGCYWQKYSDILSQRIML